ncbi:uncharacterized protein LOC105685661 isoform X1 [Athalia rosae]|uniref:uncharacterized protein LOC105685661 isoform X1 n=1 Tax=Athalia rosae TaxID=37344 RepID=UPI00203494B4|nr:uncharacterized protein LOC105685661 isoform X1 [Athalia rosae]XP_048508413.1 uncharacterized protein LOC105685661 isoform X1 [Athalia rosae]XP_048508414.1 uncharacterized protein LOC105685661 isoform X1 [Athalia rosae]XP_048508415.1 uncharacterized protein LOC105685661 isoform X1 [Athalia rosae]XP_048508416.1 uncharacterized protein LOC105685661 isoform X1 [Athalia rosae]XP_048508417.1 uncharacterized protein LOC105685661 isoform X1 [Athalia rosae]
MTWGSFGVFLAILGSIEAVTVVDHHPEEEYIIEHEILYKDAIEEARRLKIYPGKFRLKNRDHECKEQTWRTDANLPMPEQFYRRCFSNAGPIPGCKDCTSSEMTYCRDGGVLNDHCCCDNGPDDEVFKFMPHVCRIGPELCRVRAEDCAEYTRLRECCCYAYHAEKWKNKASGSRGINDKMSRSLTLLASAVIGRVFLS